MPSLPSGLPRSVTTWLSQVSVSVGATLIVTMIYAALPKISVPPFAPPPEMTSGGKFAARVLPLASQQAFDGLDTMPSPPLAAPAPVATPAPVVLAGVVASTDADPAVPPAAGPPATGPVRSIERLSKPARPPHPPLRADAKRPARLVTAQAPAPEPVALALLDEPAARDDDEWLPRAMSTARLAWAATTAASDMLLARVMPQIP